MNVKSLVRDFFEVTAYVVRNPRRAIPEIFDIAAHLVRNPELVAHRTIEHFEFQASLRTPEGQKALRESIHIQTLMNRTVKTQTAAFENLVLPRMNEQARNYAEKAQLDNFTTYALVTSAHQISDQLIRACVIGINKWPKNIDGLRIDLAGDVYAGNERIATFKNLVDGVEMHAKIDSERAENIVLCLLHTLRTSPRLLPEWDFENECMGELYLKPSLEEGLLGLEETVSRTVERWKTGADKIQTPVFFPPSVRKPN